MHMAESSTVLQPDPLRERPDEVTCDPVSFEAIRERALRRLVGAGSNPVSWDNAIAARQYLPLFDELQRIGRQGTDQRLLDWGAGRGIQMGVAADLGFLVSGVEFTEPDLLTALRAEHGDRVSFTLLDQPERLPFPTATFDVVLSMGVLEHVRESGGNEHASLTEIARVLRPGGTFVCLHLPQSSSWIEFLARTLRLPIHHHRFRYTKADIDMMVGSGGPLRLVRHWRYGFLPRNQIARILGRSSNRPKVADRFDVLDARLSKELPRLCTNHGFVAMRGQGETGEAAPYEVGSN